MTVTVVVSPEVGRGMFPQHQTHTNRHDRHDLCEQCYPLPPSITWLVVPEALVCPTCGDTDDPGQVIWPSTGCLTRCDDCNGTGRPDVTIVSVSVQYHQRSAFQDRTDHGVLVLGEGVPVVTLTPESRPDDGIVIELTSGRVWLIDLRDGRCFNVESELTDDIGPQPIKHGDIVYPCHPKEGA